MKFKTWFVFPFLVCSNQIFSRSLISRLFENKKSSKIPSKWSNNQRSVYFGIQPRELFEKTRVSHLFEADQRYLKADSSRIFDGDNYNSISKLISKKAMSSIISVTCLALVALIARKGRRLYLIHDQYKQCLGNAQRPLPGRFPS